MNNHRFLKKLSFRTETILLIICIPLALAIVSPIFHIILRAMEVDSQESFDYLTRPGTRAIMGRSFLLVGAVSFSTTLIAVPAAWLTTQTNLIGRRVWTVVLILPLVIPTYIGAFALIGAIGKGGLLEDWLGTDNLPSIFGFWGSWLALTFFTYPYVFISVRAGLKGIDPALEEASLILGKSRLTTFWRITFPQLRPFLSAGILLVALYTLSEFGAVSVMRYDVFSRAIFFQLSFNRSQAALLSLLLVIFTLGIMLTAIVIEGHSHYYAQHITRRATPIKLGIWQVAAQLFCFLIISVALIAPLGVIIYWLINGLRQGEELRDVISPLQRSFRVSALAAAITGFITLPFVFLQVRYPSRLSQLIARSVYLGYALPGIVIGLAMTFFGARYLLEIDFLGLTNYRILPLLLFAYLVRFIPQALGPSRASLLQVNPQVEESGLILGGNRAYVFRTITLPLMRSGWIAGIALVFLTVMKELPTTLMLAPAGFDTLATRIWSATDEAFYARAAAPALILVSISALSLIFILEPDD